MENVISSLHVLNSVSCEYLTAENDAEQEQIVEAMAQVLDWLHKQITALSLGTKGLHHTNEEEQTSNELLSTLRELLHVFYHWHKLQQKTEALNCRFWMLWIELGGTLDVLQSCEMSTNKEKSCAMLMMTSRPPHDFPTSKTDFNKEIQVMFSQQLWDAVIAKPLCEAPSRVVSDAAPKLIEAFCYWMTAAMHEYDLAFIVNIATPLREYLHSPAQVANSSLLTDAWLKNCVTSEWGAAPITSNAAGVAVTALVLSALTSAFRPLEVAGYLESLRATIVDELSHRPFPQPHSAIAAVAMALGLASLDDARFSNNLEAQLRSGNAMILSQFALLRLLGLPLTSTRLKPYDGVTISNYQMEVHQRVKALVVDSSLAVLQDLSFRMAEVCIEETIAYFNSSLEAYIVLIKSLQSVLPIDFFRRQVLLQVQSPVPPAVHDESLLTSAAEVVEFIRKLYEGIAPIMELLSSCNLVRSFLALSRIEFAREVCTSSSTNAAMETVTQQLEQALEQTAAPPETLLTPVLRSVAIHSMTANNEISPEIDIVAGCQALAVGLVIQHRLRILLFQCSSLLDDALSVAFSVLYNVFEPADAFGHRFIAVCLSHLTQFTPLFTVFPHYLRLTLAAFPANASPQELTKACGAIFGSLFFCEALTMPAKPDKEIVQTTCRMVLWAIRRCCERSTELLVEEDEVAVASVPTESVKDSAEEKSLSKEKVARETDGLYLAGLVFDLMKMAPMNILKAVSMEAERLLYHWKNNSRVLCKLKSALFARISQNCEAEKRAWFAAWCIYVDKLYPVETSCSKRMVPSRL